MKKFRKGQKVRILHNNTEGKVVRSWNDGDGNEYLIQHKSGYNESISTVFTELELKHIDDPVFKSIFIYAAFVIIGIVALIWSNY